MEEAIVVYPTPAIGHLISMVELAKLILTHHPSLTVHILIAPQPYNAGSTAPYIAAVSATTPSITFHNLPNVDLPPTASPNHETLTFELLRLNNPNLHQSLLSISKGYAIHALIMDFFCSHALSVAANLNIPGYYFFTSGAGCLAYFLYLRTMDRSTTKSFKDLDTHLDIPGVPPMPSSDSPKPVLDRDDEAYKCFLECSFSMAKSAGLIVNTFESLEPRVIKAISDGLCVVDGPTPPIFCVGPLTASSNKRDDPASCLRWLDLQPSRSVVFLCFGSLGLFSLDQLKEIAIGLERSGLRFLWVVRNPPTQDHSLAVKAQPEPDLDLLLPGGFLERTKERGLVVKSWAPQVAVLNHESVGGFVTHCGWNSVLEAVCAGVPLVAWPLYAEQRLNRVMLVEEIGIALPMKESESGFVSAAEVEKRVRELMEPESEEGRSIRERILSMKNEAMAALGEGGSSCMALAKLRQSWMQ
ncbi:UDP-glycosyltransferase 88A1-like [Corylus avellana]|uniref:UDP-glycosyltransferase 88A1-like n=1 Tax=Corylus avellana TaxID=13451 RepID=UPI001E225988|nr:UDP-glycosyltransferase 88A1-like [Corylus avellana]